MASNSEQRMTATRRNAVDARLGATTLTIALIRARACRLDATPLTIALVRAMSILACQLSIDSQFIIVHFNNYCMTRKQVERQVEVKEGGGGRVNHLETYSRISCRKAKITDRLESVSRSIDNRPACTFRLTLATNSFISQKVQDSRKSLRPDKLSDWVSRSSRRRLRRYRGNAPFGCTLAHFCGGQPHPVTDGGRQCRWNSRVLIGCRVGTLPARVASATGTTIRRAETI